MGKAIKKAKAIFDQYNTADPFQIAEHKDYVIMKREMPLELKGFTVKKYRIPVIHINSLYSEDEQEFTCLHEIGHIVCGHDDNAIFLLNNTTQVVNKYENEADDFACAMKLAPHSDDELSGLSLDQMASMINVDEEVISNFFKRNRTNIRFCLNGGTYESKN